MRLNTIHQDLKKLYTDKEKVKSLITFQFTIENETKRIINLFKSGYWSIMPFAFGTYNNFAIKLHPSKLIKNSNIVSINKSDGITLASNLKTFLPLQCLGFIDDIEMVKEHFIQRRKEVKEMYLPYQEYTDSLDSMDFFYDYILSTVNQSFMKGGKKY